VNNAGEIVFTELSSGTIRQIISDAGSIVNDIAISDDQRWLTAGLGNGTIKIWNINDEGEYIFFRKIAAHNGSVWSVEFSENPRFILSASEDSTYCIWNLNGQKVYGSFDEDYPPQNRDPYCKASFRGKNMVIVLTAYNKLENEMDIYHENIHIPDRQYEYYTRLDFSNGSPVVGFDLSFYIEESDLWAITDNPVDNRLPCFDYSPNGLYYALENTDNRNTGLYYADHLNLKVMQGSKPVFSNDGKYVVCIENDFLRLYPAEPSEMIRLVFNEKIFGPINFVQVK
jgi:WD40 repeat protein